MNISGFHWSYSTSNFGERIAEFYSLLQGNVRVTIILNEQSSKDRRVAGAECPSAGERFVLGHSAPATRRLAMVQRP